MALKLAVEVNGADIEYWKISGVRIDYLQNCTYVTLTGYQTATKRELGRIASEISQQLDGVFEIRDNIYMALKETPKWENAEDV